MTSHLITRDEVIERSKGLPTFPNILNKILNTIDDFEANSNLVVRHVKQDPVIAAQVLSAANTASKARQRGDISDIHAAIAMIGLGRVREIAMFSSTSGFVNSFAVKEIPVSLWTHSIAVGVCGEELANYNATPELANAAMIAGLLHDIGQLWLYCYYPAELRAAFRDTRERHIGIEIAEREHFGLDHQQIGSWLADYWHLPADICAAIRYHHQPDDAMQTPLVALVHVAEVLSNALDLTGRIENHVTTVSTPAFKLLGLIWGSESRPEFGPLFGRIEARSRHVNELMQSGKFL